MPRVARSTMVITGLALVIAVPAAVLGIRLYHRTHRPFDAKVWKAERNWAQHNPRWHMVQSLVRSQVLIGKTKPEVMQLLGPPDGVDYRCYDSLQVPGPEATRAKTFDYVLGAWSGFGIDYDLLTVEFDASGRVTRCYTWQS